MKRLLLSLVVAGGTALWLGAAMAWEPEDGEGPPRERRGARERGPADRDGGPGARGPREGGPGEGRPPRGGPDGERRRPPAPPLVHALDADHDGVISAEEIANASAALKTLDKNNDGKLTDDEIRPPRPGGPDGPPRGDFRGRRGDGPPGDGPPEGGPPRRRGAGDGQGERPGPPRGPRGEGRPGPPEVE